MGSKLIDRALALHAQAAGLQESGELKAARRRCSAAARIFERAEGATNPDLANVLTDLAEIEDELGEIRSALLHVRRAWDILTQLGRRFRGETAVRIRGRCLTILGTLLRESGCFAEAEGFLRRALQINRRHFGWRHAETAKAENNLGVLYRFSGQFGKARRLYNHSLRTLSGLCGPEALDLSVLYHNIGGLEHVRARYREAVEPARMAWEISRRHLGDDHVRTAADAAAYAAVLDGLGRSRESERFYKDALGVFTRRYGRNHYEIAAILHNLAALQTAKGERKKAEKLYRRALAIKRKVLGSAGPDIALTEYNLASLLAEKGGTGEALQLLETAAAALQKNVEPTHPLRVKILELQRTLSALTVNRKTMVALSTAFPAPQHPVLRRNPGLADTGDFGCPLHRSCRSTQRIR